MASWPGQGFLINVDVNEWSHTDPTIQDDPNFVPTSTSVIFRKAMQRHNNSVYFKSAQKSWPGVTLLARNNSQTRYAIVGFNDKMTEGLDESYDAGLLVNEQAAADYYEQTLRSGSELPAKLTAHWISGELFALLNQSGQEISTCPVSPAAMAGLLQAILGESINQTTAKTVLGEMFVTGQSAESIIASRGLQLITDTELISDLVARTLANNPEQVARYLKGKETISHWLFGQVIRQVQGQANAQLIHSELDRQLNEIKGRTGNA